MEKSFNNALATLKRNTEEDKYSTLDRVLDVVYGYSLREKDEVPELVKRYNKWCEKNHYFSEVVEIEAVMRNI